MAEIGAGMDQVDWTQEYYPLLWLPLPVRLKIAELLDAATGVRGIEMFAERLGFTQGIAFMRERCRCPSFHHSVTMFLFAELAKGRNPPSIQKIYRILCAMDSAAADVIITYLPDIIRIRNEYTSDGQQNSEPSFCPCLQCGSQRNQSRCLSGHSRNRSCSGPCQSDDQTLYHTNNSRNTRSVQTSMFQDRQPIAHYPQDQPSVRQRPDDYHAGSPFNVPTQNTDHYFQNMSVNQPGSYRHTSMQRQVSLPVRPEHQRYLFPQENTPSWIPPSTFQPLDTSGYSEQGAISQSSGQARYTRSISEPAHPSVPLNRSVSNSVRTRRRTGNEYESRGNGSEYDSRGNGSEYESRGNGSEYDSRGNYIKHESRNGSDYKSWRNRREHDIRSNECSRNGSQYDSRTNRSDDGSTRNGDECEYKTNRSEHESRTNRSEHETRTNKSEHGSWSNKSELESRTGSKYESRGDRSKHEIRINECEKRKSGNEKADFVRNDCQKCRLAADNEETMVLTLASEPSSSCAFHSNRQSGDGMAHSETYPQLQTHSLQRSSTIPEMFNSANMNTNEETSRIGTCLDDNNEMEQSMSFFETIPSFNADTHGTAKKTVFVSDVRKGQETIDPSENDEENKDEIKRKSSNLDLMFADQTTRKESYLEDINDNGVETARKTTYFDDKQTYKKRGYGVESITSNTVETARKTCYIDEILDKSNILNENGDKFQGLVSNCPICEEENRMRELRAQLESCQTYSTGVRNTPRGTQTLGCEHSQAEAQRHVTGQSSTDPDVPEPISNRKDGRHSWHEGEQNDSIDSLSRSRLSSSDSSIELVYCGSSSVSQSTISSIGSSGGTRSLNSSAKPVVLVTFSFDPGRAEAHLQEVYCLIQKLKEAEIRVRVDMDRDAFRRNGLNRQDWLDRYLTKVKFVVACISPEYADDIKPPPVDGAVAHVSQLNARYIFDYMRREYYDNRAQNRRLIPILFPNSGAQYADVPQCMTATKIYTYSEDVEEVIKIIKR